MNQATLPPPYDTVSALGCSNSRPPPAQGRVTVANGRRNRSLRAVVKRLLEDRYTIAASAEAVGSWIRRLSHHRMSPCELWDAQTSARRPHRRVLTCRRTLGEVLSRRGEPLAARQLYDRCVG